MPEFYTLCLGSWMSPYLFVVGFHPALIRMCAMHTVHLGVAQWANASAILDLADLRYFGSGNLSEQLNILTHRFNKWCKVQGIELLGFKMFQAICFCCLTCCYSTKTEYLIMHFPCPSGTINITYQFKYWASAAKTTPNWSWRHGQTESCVLSLRRAWRELVLSTRLMRFLRSCFWQRHAWKNWVNGFWQLSKHHGICHSSKLTISTHWGLSNLTEAVFCFVLGGFSFICLAALPFLVSKCFEGSWRFTKSLRTEQRCRVSWGGPSSPNITFLDLITVTILNLFWPQHLVWIVVFLVCKTIVHT